MKRIHLILLFSLILSALNIHLLAVETGKIQGKVVDENGIGLPGAEIRAKSASLQGVRTILSTKTGEFLFPLLPVGSYTLTCRLEGFNPVVQKDVIVRLGMVTSLIIKMILSDIQEEIVVTAEIPLIDKTSTNTSHRLSSRGLEKLPSLGRTVVDVVKFTPGATGVRVNTIKGTATEGQPSFRGEGEEGNNWIVDGIPISGARMRNAGLRLNFDSIDEIQIISDPFSPEFGSAYGAIINMVTKSGSNELDGELSLIFQDKNLQSAPREQLSLVAKPEYFSNYNGYFNLGGPLIKDRLWFFISDNIFSDTQQTKDSTVDYLEIPGGKKNILINNFFAKLTFALTNSHNISLTTIFNKSLGQKGGTGIPSLFEEKKFTDIIFRINYRGIINSSTFIEAGLGQVKRDSFTEPVDQDLGPAQYYIEDLARNIHNSYGNVINDQKRLDFTLKFTKHIETENSGRHELGLGFEYYSVSSQFAVDFTGKNEDLFPGNGFDSGTKYNFDSWSQGSRTPTFFYEYGVFDFMNSSRGIGIYFKDKITWNKFTVMLGLRSQTQLCLDDRGEKLWSWNLFDFLSPRLTLTVDITGDGENVLKFGWGRFSDIITTMPLGLLNSGAGLKFRTYRWNGPQNPSEGELHNQSNWQFENEQGAQPFEIAINLKPNFLTRYLIEFDRKLGKNWAFKARYIQTAANNLLEILGVIDIKKQDYKFLYDNFKHKRRNYRGFELELKGRIGTNFFLNASYSHALAKGTNPGQTETGSWAKEEGSTNYVGLFGNHIWIPDIPELAELKEYIDWALGGLGGRGIGDEGWYGKLPYSVDHNLKINAIFFAPLGISLSAAFDWISGYYWEKLGYVPYFGGYYSFPEGRGTRSTPSHAYLDFGIEKAFPLIRSSLSLSRGLAVVVRADIFNLFNSQAPVSYVKEDIPVFGEIWGRQQPRQARVMVKVKF